MRPVSGPAPSTDWSGMAMPWKRPSVRGSRPSRTSASEGRSSTKMGTFCRRARISSGSSSRAAAATFSKRLALIRGLGSSLTASRRKTASHSLTVPLRSPFSSQARPRRWRASASSSGSSSKSASSSRRRRAASPAGSGPLFLGVDLGKVTTCLAVGELSADGELRVVETHAERHLGEPLRPFLELYGRLDVSRLAGVAATGVYGDRLGEPALGGLPEEIAQEAAAAWLYPDGPLNIVRVGGGGYSVLTREARGRVSYEANERCSAGTGETVEGLCTRLGRSLAEAVELAEGSPDGVTVTSRCAVFAKSELTHFANQGESHGRIFRGLFTGVARNVHSLYDKSKVDGLLG